MFRLFRIEKILPVSAFLALAISTPGYSQSCDLADLGKVSAELRQRIHTFTLDNGLQVVLFENHQSPFTATRVVFDVGSRNESPGQEGFSHLFEHFMFRSTENMPDGGFVSVIREMGGVYNGTTRLDDTDYIADVPAENVEGVLWLDADRFEHLQVTQEILTSETGTVLEEKKLRIDNQPYLKALNDFIPVLGAGTPYTQLGIGDEASLSGADLQQVRDFLNRNYTASNAVLAVAGDIDPGQLQGFITENFAGLRRGERNAEAEQSRITYSRPYTLLYDDLAPYPAYLLLWPTVGELHPDQMLHRLVRSIVLEAIDDDLNEQQLAFLTLPPLYNDDLNAINYAGMAVTVLMPRISTSRSQVERAVNESISSLLENRTYDVCAYKRRLEREILTDFLGNQDVAYRLSADWLHHGDPLYVISRLEQLREIDDMEVESVIRGYYQNKGLLIEVSPKGLARWAKHFGEVVPDFLMRPLEKKIIDMVATSGDD